MTVGLGLVCSDGVLVASDSMASSGTIAEFLSKVHAVPALSMVWVASGPVYVAEEVELVIQNLATNADHLKVAKSGDIDQVRTNLGIRVRGAMKKCYDSALPLGATQAGFDQRHAFASDFLFLGWSPKGPWFLEIAADGQMNWHTASRFSAIGSGGPFATVAQALLGHYHSGTNTSDIDNGLLIAHRTISTTCNVSSAYVGPPVQIATATATNCRVLEQNEIDSIGVRVDGWKQIELESLATLRIKPDTEAAVIEDIPSLDNDSGLTDENGANEK
jgi:20S proteasome alpha/beta subunit